VQVEIVTVGGIEGDEIQARQIAVIWEMLRCLVQRRNR
jgi:hypothetical protein